MSGLKKNEEEDTPLDGPDSTDLTNPDIITRMPDPEDNVERERLKRRSAAKSLVSGRMSTILTSGLRTAVGTKRLMR